MSFIGTNDPFTAWKIYGATRRDSNGKRLRRTKRVEQAIVPACILTDKIVCSYFFGEAAGLGAFGAAAEPAGAGVGAGLASISSTSKIRVELAPISGPTDRSP
jgi:hypothetical protein